MELSSNPKNETTIRHQFDSFVKKVLQGEASNHKKELARRSQREKTFSELSEQELNELYATDEYPSDFYSFEVMGFDITVKNSLIGEALEALPAKKRDVVLLYYFMEMSDSAIAECMRLVGSTIHRRRTSSLQLLKKLLEVKADDEQHKE